MQIVHVVPTLGAGGTEHNALRLAMAFLKEAGTRNTVVATRLGDESLREQFEKVSDGGVHVLPESRIGRMLKFKKVVSDDSSAAVFFHFFNIDQALMAMISRCIGLNHIVAAAGNPAPRQFSARAKWKLSLFFSDMAECPVVSASAWIEASLRTLGTLPKGSRVVHNGIDVDSFRARARTRNHSRGREDVLVIGIVARLDEIKDHDTLLRGLALFLSKNRQRHVELRIVGDGPKRSQLEALARELQISHAVRFMGTRVDIPDQLACLDLFAFSTTPAEGFGNVLVEALAMGVPIIANSVPSSREVLCKGELGTLVPVQSPLVWAQTLEDFWRTGPKVPPPTIEKVKELYGLEQFYNGYCQASGLVCAYQKSTKK